jgi:hypothetical protein
MDEIDYTMTFDEVKPLVAKDKQSRVFQDAAGDYRIAYWAHEMKAVIRSEPGLHTKEIAERVLQRLEQ